VEISKLEAGLFPEAFNAPSLMVCLSVRGSVYLNAAQATETQITGVCALLIDAAQLISWRVGLELVRMRVVMQAEDFSRLRAAFGAQSVSTDPVLEHFAGIFQAQGEDVYTNSFLHPFAQTMLSHYLHRRPQQAEPSDDQRVLRQLRDFVDQRLAYDLGVDDLAKHCDLSKFQLLRLMKKELTQTPQQFVIFRRIERAKNLLRRSETSLADIAFLTGFSSQSHLSNTFKQLVGVTPKSYRDGRTSDLVGSVSQ
jgi:AraC-like DNA-binding protein